MEVKDLIFNKYYIMEVNGNNTLCKYSGKIGYKDNIYYVFMYYLQVDDEFYVKGLTENQVNTMIQSKPFMYNAMFGSISDLKRWFNQLINLVV